MGRMPIPLLLLAQPSKRRRLSDLALSLHVDYPGRSISRILSGTRLRFTSEDFVPGRTRLSDHLSGLAISRQLVAANPEL